MIALGVVGALAYAFAVYLDLHEMLRHLMERSEAWQVDELILAGQIAAVCGFIYGMRRIGDLRAEVKRRFEAEARAQHVALHDPLTQLPNRHFVEENLPQLLRQRPLGWLFIVDIDDFKRVNELAGARGGDAVLIAITDRLRTELPEAIIARMGGDEFLIAAGGRHDGRGHDGCRPDEAQAIAERIREIIARPVPVNGLTLQLAAGIGYRALRAREDLKEVTAAAELAMHEAKKNGPGSCQPYTAELKRRLAEKLDIETRLHTALAADEIDVHFQPLVRLTDRTVHGFEALARWTLSDGSAIAPGLFIPIAERAGLIGKLSESVLDKACRAALTWPGELILAFNVAPLQLVDRELPERILAVLARTGFPPERLSVEITESGLTVDLERALDTIARLRAAGVRIAIDDFGTGYSSLSQLANIPFDKLKIDRQFIATYLTSDKQARIVRAIVQIGLGLGIATLAEGIETEEQYRRLRDCGCQLGQGFLFAAAMPAAEVAAYLAHQVDPARL